MQNPNGILFNPLSVANSLDRYVEGNLYGEQDLFELNELWNCWDYHTQFSHIDRSLALAGINSSLTAASDFLKGATRVIITLGSAYYYRHKETGKAVANNHRAPLQWFDKILTPVDEIVSALGQSIRRLQQVNPQIQVLFTISPVRHAREGVVNNNRSKARLIEAVHQLCEQYEWVEYFPSYELLIDILRDYRYYDIDFVHPNYAATSYVWERFVESCISPKEQGVMKRVNDIMIAVGHRSRFPETDAHRKFKESYLTKAEKLKSECSFLDLSKEIEYFQE